MDIKIVHFPETMVAALEHKGSPAREHESVKKLIQWRIENKLSPDKHQSYGIHYTNPVTTPENEYRVDFCVSINKKISNNPQSIKNKFIPAGRCAVARHIGSRQNVTAANYLYDVWLPESGEQPGDFPMFFHYVNVGSDIAEHEMITDVYLPIK